MELRATQVRVRKVGVGEVNDGVLTLGVELRTTQVGVGEAGAVQLDLIEAFEPRTREVAVRQVRSAQVELLALLAEGGAAACNRPALVASGARLSTSGG